METRMNWDERPRFVAYISNRGIVANTTQGSSGLVVDVVGEY